jgi:hypothetical protein
MAFIPRFRPWPTVVQGRAIDALPERKALQQLSRVLDANRLRSLVMNERIVAVGLLTQRELNLLGPAFDRAWPVEEAPAFEELLRAIDQADCQSEQAGERRRD